VPRTAAFVVEALENLVVRPGAPVAPARFRVDDVALVPGETAVTGQLLVMDKHGEVIVACGRCTVRWIEGGIESVLAAAGPVDDDLRLTDAEIADPRQLPDAVTRVLAALTGVAASDIRGADTTTALGVDSLQATRLHRALEPVNPRDRVPLGDIVAGIGVADLARRLRGTGQAPAVTRRRGFLQLRKESPRLRLLCVPYGGGSNLLFRGWQPQFPDDVEVCPVSLPGRGDRLDEPLVPDVYALVDALEEEVLRSVDTPFVLYGHSAGALISYLLGIRLRERGSTALRHLCVGAFSSPGGRGNPFHLDCLAELRAAGYPDVPSAEQIQALDLDELRRLADILRFPPLPDADVNFLRMAVPVLANDIRLVGSFRHHDAVQLDVPITAVHGDNDDRVEEIRMREWKRWTSADFAFHLLDGDHFFLHPDQQRGALLDILRKRVA
jgi:surfactin synthase thioesterase subunit